tara:strand:- start:37012 stop:37383 length:372 start_codon:yes stop_codon:yes gene_type:complete
MTDDDSSLDLMKALIGKMERMDSDLGQIRKENQQLRRILRDPSALLKRAGFVQTTTPSVEDVWGDPLRGDGAIVKGIDGESLFEVPENNQDYYEMEWAEIHDLANQAKSLGHVSNTPMPEAEV